jgi:transmembrane sensor
MNIPEHIDALIAKEASDSLSSEERSTLDSWIAESPENREAYEESKSLLSLMDRFGSARKLNVDEAWSKVVSRTDDTPVIPISRGRKVNDFLRVAAVFLALIGLVKVVDMLMGEPKMEIPMLVANTATGETLVVYLPDSTQVNLNANSRIEYPAQFAANERLVKFEGEAFFEVKRDESRRFNIQTRDTEVEVLGTSFSLRARQDEPKTMLSVATGKVAFRKLPNETAQDAEVEVTEIILVAGESASFEPELGFREEEIDPNDLFWKNRTLSFEGDPLIDVLEELEMRYLVDLELSSAALNNCKLTATFQDKEISDIVEIIALTHGLEIQGDSNRYVLSGEGCD